MNLFVNLLQALNFGYLLTLLADQLGKHIPYTVVSTKLQVYLSVPLIKIAEFRLHLHPSSSRKQLFHFKKYLFISSLTS